MTTTLAIHHIPLAIGGTPGAVGGEKRDIHESKMKGGKGKKNRQQRRGPKRKYNNSQKDVVSQPATGAVTRRPPLLNACPFRQVFGSQNCAFLLSQQSKPCLKRLNTPTNGRGLAMTKTTSVAWQQAALDSLIPPQVWRSLANIPGDSVDHVHLTLVPFITSLQWKHGVYGTVGHIGDVGYGKFTSLLARVVDSTSGERLFVADPFIDDQLPQSSDETSLIGALKLQQQIRFVGMQPRLPHRHDVFSANVLDVTGFDEESSDPARRMFLYRGNLANMTAYLTSIVGTLPLFRIIAFEQRVFVSSTTSTSSLSGTLLAAVELATCILSEGGLIVLDGATEDLESTVKTFMDRNGMHKL